jgi:uncharacterized surface anchored protein
MRRTALGVLLGCLVVILTPAVVAQSTSGTIQGTVSDAAGAVLTGAAVTVVNDNNAYSRSVTSGSDGSYAFTDLPSGHYHLTVTKEGFKTEKQQDI